MSNSQQPAAKRKTRFGIWTLFFIGVVGINAAGIYGLFHGYFDHGRFEIEHSEWSPTKQVAMIAKRSDDEALSGDQIFIVVADHLLSPKELRRAYYYDRVIFRSGSDCLATNWKSSTQLVISCKNLAIDPEDITVERLQDGAVSVTYENIPQKKV
jgi:hypothetical protein